MGEGGVAHLVKFESWGEFIAMGGHGPYVFAAYGLVILGLVGMVLIARANMNAAREAIRQRALIDEVSS